MEESVASSARLPPFNGLLPTNTALAWLNRYIPRAGFEGHGPVLLAEGALTAGLGEGHGSFEIAALRDLP